MSEPQEYDLRDVEVQFISFVPRGANKKEYLAVVKELKEDIIKTILETPDEDLAKVFKESGLQGEGAEALVGAAKILKSYRDALPENAIAFLAKCTGLAAPEIEKKDVPDQAKGEGQKQAAGELSKEELEKMDPATQAIVKQLLEENTATKAEAAEARKLAKELKEKEILKEYVAKAEELPHLTIVPLKFGPVLKALGESHPKEFEEIFRVLKAAEAALEKEFFREIGKSGSSESNAEAAVYAKAKALVAKDGELTFEQAVTKVLEDDPELYERYEEERQEAVKKRSGK